MSIYNRQKDSLDNVTCTCFIKIELWAIKYFNQKSVIQFYTYFEMCNVIVTCKHETYKVKMTSMVSQKFPALVNVV